MNELLQLLADALNANQIDDEDWQRDVERVLRENGYVEGADGWDRVADATEKGDW